MGVQRLWEAERLPASSDLPHLLEEGFAQAPAVACCPKNQQRLYLYHFRAVYIYHSFYSPSL